jgi:hypothetical protein
VHLSIITILRSGQHLSHWQEVDTDSIEVVTENHIARHVGERMQWCQEIDRFIVVAGSLSWKIEIALGQHEQYRKPGLQLVAKAAS